VHFLLQCPQTSTLLLCCRIKPSGDVTLPLFLLAVDVIPEVESSRGKSVLGVAAIDENEGELIPMDAHPNVQ